MADQPPAHIDRKRYYITTAIDYSNAPPHIGHALEKVFADIMARYRRLQGYDTYFSTGVDENSQHVLRAAAAHAKEPQFWVDEMDIAFRLAWSRLDIRYDRWMRTTVEQHARASKRCFAAPSSVGISTPLSIPAGIVRTAIPSTQATNSWMDDVRYIPC